MEITSLFYFIYPVIFLLLLKLYLRLTAGRCYCQQDMTGKTVLITGASAGIGKATAMDLARRNARVLLACRNLEKTEKVKSEIVSATGNTNLEIKLLDLESFDSVRRCAEDVLKTEKRLDVLINNAAVADCVLAITKDGYERDMYINHLGPFLLTLLLLDLLKKSKPSRIINVASLGYLLGILDLEDMDGRKHNLFMRRLGNYYFRSKMANILFTMELARRLDGTGVTVNALHPGLASSDILSNNYHPISLIYELVMMNFFGKTVEEAAQTSIYAAVHPELKRTTGKFFYDCHERSLFGQVNDKAKARKLFEISEKIVGETYKD